MYLCRLSKIYIEGQNWSKKILLYSYNYYKVHLFCYSIHGHRNFYNDLRNKLSMDPRAVIGDDPLSQNDEVNFFFLFAFLTLKFLFIT